MHALLHLLSANDPTTTVAKNAKSGGSPATLFIFMGILAAAYIFFIRPRNQKMRQQQNAARQVGIGDEVVSAGGIVGRVVALDAEEVEVEVSPGVVLTFVRRSISARPQTGGARGPAPAAGPQEPMDEPWNVGGPTPGPGAAPAGAPPEGPAGGPPEGPARPGPAGEGPLAEGPQHPGTGPGFAGPPPPPVPGGEDGPGGPGEKRG